MNKIVAIDGPSGSGKGTVAKLLAKKLNYTYVDTGAMYRCVALKTLENNIDINEEEKIVEILKNANIRLTNDGMTYLDGIDVSEKIRSMEVTKRVSKISMIVPLRKVMNQKQKDMASTSNIVMEGRDITTEVFPNAEYKIYLDCDIEERANRRFKQNKEKNIKCTIEEIKNSLVSRDYDDENRKVGKLKRDKGQYYVDTTKLSIDEVVNKIFNYIDRDKNIELIDVLDENGNKTGEILERSKVNEKGLFHKIAAVCIFDKNKNILMQKRSKEVDSYPSKWDVTAAGHLSSGEESNEAAIRELSEEVGMYLKSKDLEYILSYKSDSGNIIDCFIACIDMIDLKKIDIQEEEVSKVKICDKKMLINMIKDDLVVKRDEFYDIIISKMN